MITAERLRELLDYDPETGVFIWKINRASAKAGSVAGSNNGEGYVSIGIDNKSYLAHRLAWLYVYGAFPPSSIDVDHKDRNRENNWINNLRLATRSQNNVNTAMVSTAKSGYRGVYWSEKSRKWQAKIVKNRRQIYLGVFETPEEASSVYCSAAEETFGEFANVVGWIKERRSA